MTRKTKNRSLVQTKTAETCRGEPLELRYYRLEERTPDGAVRFGAAIEAVCEGARTCAQVTDICVSQEEIDQLLALLARGTATPVSLREVVDDWL